MGRAQGTGHEHGGEQGEMVHGALESTWERAEMHGTRGMQRNGMGEMTWEVQRKGEGGGGPKKEGSTGEGHIVQRDNGERDAQSVCVGGGEG